MHNLNRFNVVMGFEEPRIMWGSFYNSLSCRLRPKAYIAYVEMREKALKDGIHLKSASSYRPFERQRDEVWNKKFQNEYSHGSNLNDVIYQILRTVSIPGTSRHHFGTEIDLVEEGSKNNGSGKLLKEHYIKPGGISGKVRQWLEKNAREYGFVEVYTNDPFRSGFEFEPWHYSFAEESISLLGVLLDIPFEKYLKGRRILGEELFTKTFFENYKQKFILGINPALKPG